MKLLLPLVLALTAMNAFSQTPPIEPGVSHDLAIWRAAHYSDVRYKLDLTLEKMSPVLKGTIEIRVNITPGTQASPPASPQSGEIPPIILDWRKLAGHEKDSTISNVVVNGKSALFDRPRLTADGVTRYYADLNEHLIFYDNIILGENLIKLDFTSPILTSGSAITRYLDKEDGSEYIYSLFVPSDASTAFPIFDQPDIKARFSLQVVAPEDWRVISNAVSDTPWQLANLDVEREVEWNVCGENDKCHQDYKKPRHTVITDFFETKPISTYVFAFAAGPFEQFVDPATQTITTRKAKPGESLLGALGSKDDTVVELNKGVNPNRVFVRKSQVAKFQPHAAEVFKMMREGVAYLEDYFDYKFPWPKYDLVLIPEFPFGGMEHAGETFVRESAIIFPSEPTKNDHISRATLIFHETAHQWFGDTVTMRWFDDLWLKEGFANFMAYKALEKIRPEMNSWKAFYERIKQPAYVTDSTKGTTPIYQRIDNLSAAKSAYGNIVYNKAPSFLRQAEFYLGPDKFQTAVRAFLKKHAFANATWQDLVSEFEAASGQDLKEFAQTWVKQRGMPVIRTEEVEQQALTDDGRDVYFFGVGFKPTDILNEKGYWLMKSKVLFRHREGQTETKLLDLNRRGSGLPADLKSLTFVFPNYDDYGYGIFLLDPKSRDYVLKNIQNEKDDFLRSMMWGALWDSVREAELDPRQYVELAIKALSTTPPAKPGTPPNQGGEQDEMIIASVLGRVSTAMTYYLSEPPASAGGLTRANSNPKIPMGNLQPPADAGGSDLSTRLETMLIDRLRTAPTLGQRLTYYRAFLNIVSTENGRGVLKQILKGEFGNTGGNATVTERAPTQPKTARPLRPESLPLKTKDKFDIVTRLAILGDAEAPKLLADLEKTETSDDAKRYAYATHAAFATKENREKFWNDFVSNKDISESWIEAAMNPFNSPRHADLSLPYLERSLKELPNLKRTRKIFFINGWLGAFLGGQKSQEALDIVNKFLADNPNLDRDLRLKILENVDVIERSVKIRNKFSE